jgi:hypothetical protein
LRTHKDDSLLFSSIGKDARLACEPGLLDSLAHLDTVFGLCLGKGLGRVFESKIRAVLLVRNRLTNEDKTYRLGILLRELSDKLSVLDCKSAGQYSLITSILILTLLSLADCC